MEEEEEEEENLVNRGAHVYVNIYDVAMILNSTFRRFGIGVYHTSVQIYNREYSYAGHRGATTGVRVTNPRDSSWIQDTLYFDTIYMGRSPLSPLEVSRVYRSLRNEYRGHSYSPMLFNCNDFTRGFLLRVGIRRPLPTFVSRVRDIGQWVVPRCCLPDSVVLPIVEQERRRLRIAGRKRGGGRGGASAAAAAPAPPSPSLPGPPSGGSTVSPPTFM